jgi:hypothetical protein
MISERVESSKRRKGRKCSMFNDLVELVVSFGISNELQHLVDRLASQEAIRRSRHSYRSSPEYASICLRSSS